MKKVVKFLFSRLTLTTVFILFQVFLMIVGTMYFSSSYKWVPFLMTVIEMILIIDVVNRDMPADLKIPWLAVIMLVPVAGIVIYLLFSRNRASKKESILSKNIFINSQKTIEKYEISSECLSEYQGQSNYIKNTCDCGLFENTNTKYFDCGETFFQEYLEDLQKAKHFIFLEYFIIERGLMFDSILEILKQKVQEGVEVRLMYDDIGTIGKVPSNYNLQLKKLGINCVKFRPFLPFVSAVHNNRNHRKITVIDGVIGYVGGINLADEYINVIEKYGYWKDSTIKIEGDATRQLTVMFLQNFGLQTRKVEEYEKYTQISINMDKTEGYVQPLCDGPNPLYPELICENVYLNMINQAKKSICIATPYLIIDSLIKNALISAVKRGVDVKIFTPNIPDKKLIFIITRSNYRDLIKHGVEIYEYQPGFLHTKDCLIDDELALVGTINLDYRSLVHHYECGILMYKTTAVGQIIDDFNSIYNNSIYIDPKKFKLKWYEIIIAKIIGIFSPLM